MIDVKQKIHIDVVALYDLAYQNDLPEVCKVLSNVEYMVWKLRRRDDKENHCECGLNEQGVWKDEVFDRFGCDCSEKEADDQSYFENLQECLNL